MFIFAFLIYYFCAYDVENNLISLLSVSQNQVVELDTISLKFYLKFYDINL